MSDLKGRLKTESPRELQTDPERMADILVDKGTEQLAGKVEVAENAQEANAAQGDVETVANKVMKEAPKTLQREEETSGVGENAAGSLAAQAQAVVAKKDDGKEGDPEFATAGFVRDRVAHFQQKAAQGSGFAGPNPEGSTKRP